MMKDNKKIQISRKYRAIHFYLEIKLNTSRRMHIDDEISLLVLLVPGGNLVDGLPPARHLKSNTEPRSIGSARHPRTSVNFVIAFVFLRMFYIWVTSFVPFTLNTSYWSLIFCDYELPSSIKPWLTRGLWVFQMLKNDEKIEISEKSQKIYFYFKILN